MSCSVSNGTIKNIAAYQKPKPDYRISIYRKFEIAELCQMFVGKWFKYVYLFFLTTDQFLGNWSFASVAGSAWASKIPYTFGKANMCNDDAFHHQILPSGGCLYSYYFSLFLFGVIVITLSMLDLKEQVVVQVILGLARLITIAGIIVYTFVRLVNANDSDTCKDLNSRTFTNFTMDNQSFTQLHNASQHFSYEDIALKFDPKGWIASAYSRVHGLISLPPRHLFFHSPSQTEKIYPLDADCCNYHLCCQLFSSWSCGPPVVQSKHSGDSHPKLGKHIYIYI